VPAVRVALIGCGHVSQYHLRAWFSCDDVEVVAVCDPQPERAEAAARVAGAASYGDAAAMMTAERPDLVDIATRSDAHRALIECAARRGIHVLCQKPLCRTLAEARDAVRVCESAGVAFMVVEIARFLPWTTALAEHCHVVGPPHHYRYIGERNGARVARMLREQPYLFGQRELIIRERVIHSIDAARFLLGDVETVSARAARVNKQLAGEDGAVVLLGHRTGATSLHDFSWTIAPDAWPSQDECFTLEGARGALTLSFADGRLLAVTDTVRDLGVFDRAAGFQRGFDRAMQSFVAAVRDRVRLAYSAGDNINTLEAMYGAYESAAAGRTVRIM
jgi:predicted dehydrogenase